MATRVRPDGQGDAQPDVYGLGQVVREAEGRVTSGTMTFFVLRCLSGALRLSFGLSGDYQADPKEWTKA